MWKRKKVRLFFFGLFHVVFMQVFINIFFYTHNQFALVRESYYVREELCRQFLGVSCAQMPKQFKSGPEAYTQITKF